MAGHVSFRVDIDIRVLRFMLLIAIGQIICLVGSFCSESWAWKSYVMSNVTHTSGQSQKIEEKRTREKENLLRPVL